MATAYRVPFRVVPNFVGSVAEASDLLQALAEPSRRGDRIKSAIDRAAKASGIHYWRAFDLWYRKARRVEYDEIIKIREAARAKSEGDLQDEFEELEARISELSSKLLAEREKLSRQADALDRERLRRRRQDHRALA